MLVIYYQFMLKMANALSGPNKVYSSQLKAKIDDKPAELMGHWAFKTFFIFILSSHPVGTVLFKLAQYCFSEVLTVVCYNVVVGIRLEPLINEPHQLISCATTGSHVFLINNFFSPRTILVVWIVYVEFLKAITAELVDKATVLHKPMIKIEEVPFLPTRTAAWKWRLFFEVLVHPSSATFKTFRFFAVGIQADRRRGASHTPIETFFIRWTEKLLVTTVLVFQITTGTRLLKTEQS